MRGRGTGIQIQMLVHLKCSFQCLCVRGNIKSRLCVCVCYCDRVVSGEIRHQLPVDPVYFLAGFTWTITMWATV